MQQWKTTGYSASVLLLLCLTTTDGFLEANRNFYERGNRNFFGNTLRLSSETRQEANDLRRVSPFENSAGTNNKIIREDYHHSTRDTDSHKQMREDKARLRSIIREDHHRDTTIREDNTRRIGHQDNKRVLPERIRQLEDNRRLSVDLRRDIREDNSRRVRLSREDDAIYHSSRGRDYRQYDRRQDNTRRTRNLSSVRREMRLSFPDSLRRVDNVRIVTARVVVLDKEKQKPASTDRRIRSSEVRSASGDRSGENYSLRQIQEQRSLETLGRYKDTRDRRLHSDLKQDSARVTTQRRDSRSVSLDRANEIRNRERLVSSSRQDDYQMQRQRVRSISEDRSRTVNTAQESLVSIRRNVNNRLRSDTSPRVLADQNDGFSTRRNQDGRQMERREIRSTTFERSRTVDNSRRLFDDQSRGISTRRIQNGRQVASRETRLVSFDTSRTTDNSRRVRGEKYDEISTRRNQNGRQMERREIRSTTLDTTRTIDNSRRVRDEQYGGPSTGRNQNGPQVEPLETRSVSFDRSKTTDKIRSRTIDNSRRLFDDQSRGISTRRIQNGRHMEARETRSVSFDTSRTTDNSRRVREEQCGEISTRSNQNGRKMDRREIRSATLDTPRTVGNSRRVRDEQYGGTSTRRNQNGRQMERRENQSATLDTSRTVDNSRRVLDEQYGGTSTRGNQDGRQMERREIRSASFYRSRTTEKSRRLRVGQAGQNGRLVEKREISSRRGIRTVKIPSRKVTLHLSSRDETINENRYFARTVAGGDTRQSVASERRMATSFKSIRDVDYIPEMASHVILYAAKALLVGFLVAQVLCNSSKTKGKWFNNLTNFVTVTKEKVL